MTTFKKTPLKNISKAEKLQMLAHLASDKYGDGVRAFNFMYRAGYIQVIGTEKTAAKKSRVK